MPRDILQEILKLVNRNGYCFVVPRYNVMYYEVVKMANDNKLNFYSIRGETGEDLYLFSKQHIHNLIGGGNCATKKTSINY